MPELPEVETIVQGLKKKVSGRTITGFWTDWPKYFRQGSKYSRSLEKSYLKEAERYLVGKRIESVTRRAKNILINLSGNDLLLIHQKLSGHLMVGRWVKNPLINKSKSLIQKAKKTNTVEDLWSTQHWLPASYSSPLAESMNRFLRLIFFLDNGDMIGFSDIRRFGKVLFGPENTIMNLPDLKDLGPEPLNKSFTAENLASLLKNKRGPIKQILLDQSFVVGIGNIYADEILWKVKLHPLSEVKKLTPQDTRELYMAIKDILSLAVKLRGSSVGDYRDSSGREGGYEKLHKAYQKTGLPCARCKTPIKRMKIGVRSAHFCPECQKYN